MSSTATPAVRRAGKNPAAEKRLVLDTVMEGRASSRGEISRLLSMRSTTVSDHVGQLLEAGLLVESAGRASGRGRPASLLVGNANALAAIVVHVVSQSMRATVVNFRGQAVFRDSVEVEAGCGNARMRQVIGGLFRRSVAGVPKGTRVAGIALSLSGVLDAGSRAWLFSSRWPRLTELDVGAVVEGSGLPILVTRNLDAELRARVRRDGLAEGGTLILHWGYGIGAAYAVDGTTVNGREGRFGEIGHWRLNRAASNTCRCGRSGCLETIAALWALEPVFREIWPDTDVDEARFAEQARARDLLAVPAFREALDSTVVGLANMCRILFPRRIIVSGPFIANPQAWAAFNTRFREEGVLVNVETPKLIADQRSEELELEGAARPLLETALDALLAQ